MTFKTSLAAGLLAAFALPTAALADAAILDAYARATPPGARNGAAYATISSVEGDRLLGAASPAAAMVQVHDTTVEGGVAKMREIEGGLEIPPGGSVSLEPGGKHIMLMGLAGPLMEGEEITLTFTFEKAGAIEVAAPVRSIGALMHGHEAMPHDPADMPHGHGMTPGQ